jgi:hypothetical protein
MLLQSKNAETQRILAETRSALTGHADENSRLILENDALREELDMLKASSVAAAAAESGKNNSSNVTLEDIETLELLLGETRAKLASALLRVDDLTLAKDFALRQLDYERMLRLSMEKERDAYSAAYEASLQHSEKWAKDKVKHQTLFSLR